MDIEETLERNLSSHTQQDLIAMDLSSSSSSVLDPTAVVTKTRRVQVKLTGERLMDSERGLPYLMKIGKKRLHISSKKTNFENLSSIIQLYQLWAHQLYPKAKFNDFVKLCQQLGRSDKSLREFRKDVIRKELGISSISENENSINNTASTTNNSQDPTRDSNTDSINNLSTNPEHNTIVTSDKNPTNTSSTSTSQAKSVFVPDEEEEEDYDDDDDLYTLSTFSHKKTANTEPSVSSHPDVEKNTNSAIEEEIHKLEQEQLNDANIVGNIQTNNTNTNTNNGFESDFEEDEEALEAMREFDI